MKTLTPANYRDDQRYPRVVNAVAELLAARILSSPSRATRTRWSSPVTERLMVEFGALSKGEAEIDAPCSKLQGIFDRKEFCLF